MSQEPRHYPSKTLLVARQIIRNHMAEIAHLTHGDLPEAWDMAGGYAAEMVDALKVCQIELAHFHPANLLQGPKPEPIYTEFQADTNSAEEDAAMAVVEAEAVERAHPIPSIHPVFSSLIQGLRPGA